jgi:Cu2+-exporting ATPase
MQRCKKTKAHNCNKSRQRQRIIDGCHNGSGKMVVMFHNSTKLKDEFASTSGPLYDNCRHCQQTLLDSQKSAGFCCNGCSSAYSFIHKLKLEKFYGFSEKIDPGYSPPSAHLQLFDDLEFQEKFCTTCADSQEAQLFITGMSCYACSWLISEALRSGFPDVRAEVSLSQSSLKLIYDRRKFKLSEIVALVQNLGYRVSPLSNAGSFEQHDDLVRSGVSTFCFLNIMLLAAPEYVDANIVNDVTFWQLFRWMSLALAAVVMVYCAKPLLTSAMAALRARRLNVDQSIAVALLASFIYSAVNVLRSQGEVYFDSVSAIVTLLGWGRYVQKHILTYAEQSLRGNIDYIYEYVRQLIGRRETLTPLMKLKDGDEFYVLAGDVIPVDAEVMAGESQIHYEQITGEARPEQVRKSQVIKAGAINLSRKLELKALEDGKRSVLLKINQHVSRIMSDKGGLSSTSEKLASYFFLMVMVVSASILAFTWSISPEEAFSRAIAALLIACPCVFALSVPLTMASCAAAALRRGIVIKSQRAIESMNQVKTFLFDKTGTLTVGSPCVTEQTVSNQLLESLNLSQHGFYEVLVAAAELSSHHTLKSLKDWAMKKASVAIEPSQLSNFQEEIAQGVSFESAGVVWQIGRREFCGVRDEEGTAFSIYIAANGQMLAGFRLEDELHSDVARSLTLLKEQGFRLEMITGDRLDNAVEIAARAGISESLLHCNLTPFSKATYVGSLRDTGVCVVGNGFNDSLAMAKSDVGICVNLANQQSKNASDIYLQTEGISGVVTALDLCRRVDRKIRLCFAFTITFNVVGLSAAALGYIHPVVAAIAMPISSSIVTFIATNKWSWVTPASNSSMKLSKTLSVVSQT